jgi:hypothetical protein
MSITPRAHPSDPTNLADERWRETHLGRLLGHAMRRFDERVLNLMAGNEGVPWRWPIWPRATRSAQRMCTSLGIWRWRARV